MEECLAFRKEELAGREVVGEVVEAREEEGWFRMEED